MRDDYVLSLKQGLDSIPDGVCFSKNGKPSFTNATMKKIMKTAFKTGEADASVFDKLCETELNDGCRAEKTNDGALLFISDGGVWNIKTKTIKLNDEIYNECIAFNITELYGKSLELKERNDRIRATNEKIREYNRKMDSVIRDRELLDAKIKIHDDVGRALLSLRSYLYRQDKDRESLVKLWRVTISVLRRETISDVSDDMMEALAEASAAVDVTLHYGGDIPNDPLIREISANAIRECLTNTVKHAQGHNIFINTTLYKKEFIIKIKNDGAAPQKQIEETGGLYTLRKSVERYGGEMSIEWKNGFELTIKLARKG